MKTQTNATTGTWVVVAWDLEDGPKSAQVVQEFSDRAWADGYVGEREVYGDPGLGYRVMPAARAARLGIE